MAALTGVNKQKSSRWLPPAKQKKNHFHPFVALVHYTLDIFSFQILKEKKVGDPNMTLTHTHMSSIFILSQKRSYLLCALIKKKSSNFLMAQGLKQTQTPCSKLM